MKSSSPQVANKKTLSFTISLKIRLIWLFLQQSKLAKGIRHLGSWIELEAAQIAAQTNQSVVRIQLKKDATVQDLRIGSKKYPQTLNDCTELWKFLLSIDISEMELDVRLEANQIADVFSLLYVSRRNIQRRNNTNDLVKNLLSENGMLVACTLTGISDRKLTVSYSYCATRFSRLVHFFENRHKIFRDHRAIFQAAPKFALLIALIATIPIFIFAIANSMWLLTAILVIEGLVLFGIMYLLFMIIGSVEYDNEEKAYRLNNAFGRLKSYTDRIIADTRRARIVQEKILPDLSNMPLSDRVDWASCFMPQIEVGGDYFDVQTLNENEVTILFCDVSGHGMAAAFITAILKTTFQNCVDSNVGLIDLIKKLNSALFRLTPEDSFAAVFAATYDASTKRLTYVNAGHHPEPWHMSSRGKDRITSLSDARSMILGIQKDIEIVISNRTLDNGDIILMASDGFIENQNADGQEYGSERFVDLLRQYQTDGVGQLVQIIAEQAKKFCAENEQCDDRTILALQIKE